MLNTLFRARFASWVCSVLCLAIAGCGSQSPSAVKPQAIDPEAPQKAMQLYDGNGDGLLDDKELEKVPGLKAAQKRLGDKVNADAIAARIESWRQSRVGRLSVFCRVTHQGKPLAGATVTVTPESFLGAELAPAHGTTNAAGIAVVSGADGLPGMSPGFYRVAVSKSGEKIPAQYNLQTVLGLEVAADAVGVDGGFAFNLTY